MDSEWQLQQQAQEIEQLKRLLQGCSQVQITDRMGVSYMVPALMLGGSSSDEVGSESFRIVSQSDGTQTQYGVSYNSTLYKSLAPGDTLTISGLLGDDPPDGSDPGWFTLNNGDLVWLEVTISNGAATAASIGHGTGFSKTAAAWSGGSYVEDDGGTPPKQTLARKLIGYLDSGRIYSTCSSALLMTDCVINGKLASYPIPA